MTHSIPHRAIRILVASLLAPVAASLGTEPLPAQVEFNRDIRPILSDTCFHCHGPDKAKRKADLRLDIEADAKARIDDHFAILPGDPAKSELIRRITTNDDDDRMPPADSGRQLTPQQIEMLRRWIAQGAKWQPHWSLIAPQAAIADCGSRIADLAKRDPARAAELRRWPQGPIDQFILDRLLAEGLTPSPPADPATLIRRMSLDLTGLPPTPAEVDAFTAECREGSSFVIRQSSLSALADRLLASPRYGERMAIRWLDAARYADTSGYQSDGERSMWRWRDWVIEAFNRNMPFDQFTIEQLAGDMLPGATRAQRIATGFNRNHRGNAEGGIIPEEYAAEYVVDRVDTTATVWLGLTMGCARCHDHKYDPIAQREFYQMFAIFNNVPEKGRAIKIGNSPPMIPAPTDAQERELAQLDHRLAAAETHLRKLEPQIAAAQAAWEMTLAVSEVGRASRLSGAVSPERWTVTQALDVSFDLNGTLASTFGKMLAAKSQDGDPEFVAARGGQAAVFDGRRYLDCGAVGDFGFFDKFTLAAWIHPRGANGGAILSRMVEESGDSAFASDSEGYRAYLKDGRLQLHLTKRWLDDALRVETEAVLAPDRWHHVAVVYDGSRLASGVQIFVNGEPQKLRVLLDQLNQTFQTKQPFRIGAGGGPANRFQGMISDVRIYRRALSAEEVGIVSVPENANELAAIPTAPRTAHQAAKLRSCFLAEHAAASLREADATAGELRERRAKFIESLPTVMVMEEMAEPRETFVLKRGEYDKRGERVMPGVPASMPPLPEGEARNRLGFARWLVSPANPLTARVVVNQQWQMLFGAGLVKTTEDFGSQGEPPSHAELLDWLATEFAHGSSADNPVRVTKPWDMKALLRLIVTSATYSQSSRVTPALLQRDPENRLLARGPRVRLPAEMVRDQALAVSGLLVGEIGGPSVKPYQPKGLWKELSGTDYEPDHGAKLWRRSLYTFWKRTSPPPTMTTFDAAGRESCSVRPGRTSTPLQALALMNDVTFVEAARCLAQRSMREGGATTEDRLRFAFRLVLARAPKPAETSLLLDDWNHHLSRFRAEPKAAQGFLSAGESPLDERLDATELAAHAAVAGLILNLDEAITKQ